MRIIFVLLLILSTILGFGERTAIAEETTVEQSEVTTNATACTCIQHGQSKTLQGESCELDVAEEVTSKKKVEDGPLFSFENFAHLLVLIFLQAVLGFDNLLYISIESQRAPKKKQKEVRKYGIFIAIILRVVLLFVMIALLDSLTDPLFTLSWTGVVEGGFNFASIVFIFGGGFIMYTAVKEISHMLVVEDLEDGVGKSEKKTAKQAIIMIVIMNLVFSFDSILSALAITKVFFVLAIAIIVSGIGMYVLADRVAEFIERNRKYEVLGMFILLIVGIVLLGEGGQAAAHALHDQSLALRFFGYEVVPMSKSTFYFSIAVLVLVDIIQTGYQKKLDKERD